MTSYLATHNVRTQPAPPGPAGRHRADYPDRLPTPARLWGRGARAAAVACFVAVAVLANAAAYRYRLVPVGFGLHATASTLAVGVIALHNTWLRELGGQRLVFAAIAAATLASTCAAGAFGIAWGIAYLVAELVGLCTWRPLHQLGAHDGQSLVAFALTALVEAAVYTALISPVAAATTGGQLLGKAEAALATAAVVLPVRAAPLRRSHTAGGRHG
jgi:hypothetical protein